MVDIPYDSNDSSGRPVKATSKRTPMLFIGGSCKSHGCLPGAALKPTPTLQPTTLPGASLRSALWQVAQFSDLQECSDTLLSGPAPSRRRFPRSEKHWLRTLQGLKFAILAGCLIQRRGFRTSRNMVSLLCQSQVLFLSRIS